MCFEVQIPNLRRYDWMSIGFFWVKKRRVPSSHPRISWADVVKVQWFWRAVKWWKYPMTRTSGAEVEMERLNNSYPPEMGWNHQQHGVQSFMHLWSPYHGIWRKKHEMPNTHTNLSSVWKSKSLKQLQVHHWLLGICYSGKPTFEIQHVNCQAYLLHVWTYFPTFPLDLSQM